MLPCSVQFVLNPGSRGPVLGGTAGVPRLSYASFDSPDETWEILRVQSENSVNQKNAKG